MSRYRKIPVVVDAIRWTGDNEGEVTAFTNRRFRAMDAEDRANCDDPDATAEVFDRLHSTWVLVYTGDWIIQGVQGEFYPIRDSVFQETYEEAE